MFMTKIQNIISSISIKININKNNKTNTPINAITNPTSDLFFHSFFINFSSNLLFYLINEKHK